MFFPIPQAQRTIEGLSLRLLCAFLLLGNAPAWGLAQNDLLDMSLEQLMNVEITSVSKKSQSLSQSAAAIFVISQDDIRRSGATNIPDALRMAPGVQVARIDSNKWAVTARGFNGRFAKNLLVLIDGRSVYSPTFSGVYWDMQDVMMEDVDRIEVIRGPGATLWGSNAVNGVINIITKSAVDTQGGRLSLGAGTVEKGFGAVRYGVKLGEDTYARVYGKGFSRSSFNTSDGRNSGDDWDRGQGGFRIDHQGVDGSSSTLQGDAYAGDVNQRINQPSLSPFGMIYTADAGRISGFNLLGRWRKPLAQDSEVSVQAYYDHTYKRESYNTQERDTFDVEMQHRFGISDWHDVVWGLGYRLNQDFISSPIVLFGSPRQDRQLFNAFIQDEMTLIEDRLKLTLGSKLEHNEYTGFEGQPNIRLAWTPSDHHTLWGAISRAVRIPSRGENDGRILTQTFAASPQTFNFPVAVYVDGNRRFRSEELLAYELGYRFLPSKDFSTDIALFYNRYDRLRDGVGQPQPDFATGVVTVDGRLTNAVRGVSYGAELAVDWRPLESWTLQASYTYLKLELKGSDFGAPSVEANNPQNQLSLRSALSLPHQISFDLWYRYVDRIKAGYPDIRLAQRVSDYSTLDARIAWKPMPDLQLSVVGQNLLDNRHLEFVQEVFAPQPTLIPRSVYFKLDWQF